MHRRLTGPLTITGKGKDFVDVIVASYLANLEWRKHNNKIWQIIVRLPQAMQAVMVLNTAAHTFPATSVCRCPRLPSTASLLSIPCSSSMCP